MILQVDPSTDSLRNFFYNGRLFAEDGKAGVGNECTGRSGDDAVFKVPPGTLVSRLAQVEDPETGEIETKAEIVADLVETGSSFVLCKGGRTGASPGAKPARAPGSARMAASQTPTAARNPAARNPSSAASGRSAAQNHSA